MASFDPRRYHGRCLERYFSQADSEIAVMVPSTRLDTLPRGRQLKQIDYLSIDADGAKRAVFRFVDFDESIGSEDYDIVLIGINNEGARALEVTDFIL